MFKPINQLLYKTNKSKIDFDILNEFNGYFTSKVFSFYNDGEFCEYINDTLNMYGNVFPSKEDQYQFFDNVIPKVSKKKIPYLKKNPIKKEEIQPIPEFSSKREIDLLNTYRK